MKSKKAEANLISSIIALLVLIGAPTGSLLAITGMQTACSDECSSVADCSEPRCDGNTELWMCWDQDSDGCNECVPESFDCGSVHNCYEDRGCDMWTGSCGDGVCDNIECETCFEACPEDCGGSCSSSNLDLCLAPTSCTSAGGNWCDQGEETYICQSAECPSCDAQHLTLCYNEGVCLNLAGGHWCDDDEDDNYECQLTQCAAAACTDECTSHVDCGTPICEMNMQRHRCFDIDGDGCKECFMHYYLDCGSMNCYEDRGCDTWTGSCGDGICDNIECEFCSQACPEDCTIECTDECSSVVDCGTPVCGAGNTLRNVCEDIDRDGCNECVMNANIACSSDSNCYEGRGCEKWWPGSCGDGICDNIECETCSQACPEDCGGGCSASNLGLCLASNSCLAAGGHWCDDDRDNTYNCQSAECAVCDAQHLHLCYRETTCIRDVNGYWCDDDNDGNYECQLARCAGAVCTHECTTPSVYGTSSKECINKGYTAYCKGSTSHFPMCGDKNNDGCYECYWSSTYCSEKTTCSATTGLCEAKPSLYVKDYSQERCYSSHLYWCDPDNDGVYGCKQTEEGNCIPEHVCSIEHPEECNTVAACEAIGFHLCDDDRDYEPECQAKECALCVSSYLIYCPTQEACEDAGGTWCNPGKNIYGNEVYICLKGACTSCHEKYIDGCTTKNSCEAVGGSWCDVNIVDNIEKLRMGVKPATPSTSVYSCQDKCISCSSNWPELCKTKSECDSTGRNWCDDNEDGTYNCQLQKCKGCSKNNLELCVTKETCEDAKLYWCKDIYGKERCEYDPCKDLRAFRGECEHECITLLDCNTCRDGAVFEFDSCRDSDGNGCRDCADLISVEYCGSGLCLNRECLIFEICDDGKDNNDNGMIDCDDLGCKYSIECKPPECDYDGVCERIFGENSDTCVDDCPICNYNHICDLDETLACRDCNYEEEWVVSGGKIVMKPVTCNNNGICEENEKDYICPNDCWRCNEDGYCSEKERYYTCYQDCGDACNNDGDCDEDENVNSCVGDCFKGCNNNEYCDFGETHENCPGDCVCNGNGVCDIEAGETISECSEECVSRKGCYPNGDCWSGETIESCPEDCKCNNDGNCNKGRGGEDYKTCPNDCKPPWYCGDGSCNYGAYTLGFSEDCSTCPEDCGIPNYLCCDGENRLGNCCNDGDCKADDICVDYKCVFDEKRIGELARTYKLTSVSSPRDGCSMSGETLGNCGVNKHDLSATFYFDVKHFKYVKKAFLSIDAIAYQHALFSVACLNSKGEVIAVVRDDFNPSSGNRGYFHMMIPEKCFQDNKPGFVMEWISGDSQIYSMAIEVTEEEEICNHNKVCDGDEDYDVCPKECPLPKLAIQSFSINPTISSSFGVDLTVKNIDEKKIKYFRTELGLYDEGSELATTFIDYDEKIKPGEVKEINFPQIFGEALHNQGAGRYLLRVSLTGVPNAKDVVYEKELFYPGTCGENEKGKIIDEKGHQLYCNGFHWTECTGDDESSYSIVPVQNSWGIIMEGERVRICTDEKKWTANAVECVEEFEGRAIKMKRWDLLCASSKGKGLKHMSYPYFWVVCNENSKGITVNVNQEEILCDGEMWVECGSHTYMYSGSMEHNRLKGLDPMDDDFNFINRVKLWEDAVLTRRNKWKSEIYICRDGHWRDTCIMGEGVRISDVNYLCVDSDKGYWRECSGNTAIKELKKGGETGYFLCDGGKWTECGGGDESYFISSGSVDKAVPYDKVLASTKNYYYCYGDKRWKTSVPIKLEYEARAYNSVFELGESSFEYISEDVSYSGTPKPNLKKTRRTIEFNPPNGLAEGNLYAYAKGEFIVGLNGEVEGTSMTLIKYPQAGASAYMKITDLRDGKQLNDAKSGLAGPDKIHFMLGEEIVYPDGYNSEPGFKITKEEWEVEEDFDVVPSVEVLNIPHMVGMMYGNYGIIKLNLRAGNKGNDYKKLINPEMVVSTAKAAVSKDIYIPGKEIFKDSHTLFEIELSSSSKEDYQLLSEDGDKADKLSFKVNPKEGKPVSFLIMPKTGKVQSTLVLYVNAEPHFWRIAYDEPDYWAYQSVKTVIGFVPGAGPLLQKACELSQRGVAVAGTVLNQKVFGTDFYSKFIEITYKI
ncbi:MAG: hypothetical protein ISS23_03045 [Nanoarchaeota archaeon]|nr:hypothetical protein [Nanoarchaeota archaeon]